MTTVLSIHLPDEAATIELGESLALVLKAGDSLALIGDLGAGKSTLSRALIRAVADEPFLEVPSPTFTIMQVYPLRLPIAHLDLYRLGDLSELDELGLDEFLQDGICLIEWPEIALDELSKDATLILNLDQNESGRIAHFSGSARILDRLKRVLTIRDFLNQHGYGQANRRFFCGDASSRAYELLQLPNGNNFILMDWPKSARGAVIKDGKTYPEIAHITQDTIAFTAISKLLIELGFTAPAVLSADTENGLLVLEDLGREGVLDENGKPISDRYIASALLLASLHSKKIINEYADYNGHPYRIPEFDADAIKIEVSLLLEWFISRYSGISLSEKQRIDYYRIWDNLIDILKDAEKTLLMRDFHSPNIIWCPDRTGDNRVGLIDFQDAMIGPAAYDLASLIQDARVDIPETLQQEMLEAYFQARSFNKKQRDDFLVAFAIMSAQRNCKLAGIWVRLKTRDNKPAYMKHMPRTFYYLRQALSHPQLSDLKDWFDSNGIDLFQR